MSGVKYTISTPSTYVRPPSAIMPAIRRKFKTLLMGFLIIYLIVNVYQTLVSVMLDRTQAELMEKVLRSPLCTAHEDVVKRLKSLAKDLVYVRLGMDRDVTMAKQIEGHYDSLQKLLREIEFISSAQNTEHEHIVDEEDAKLSTVVCPEEYKGSTYGYPFYRKGFETTRCLIKTPIENLFTLIIDGVGGDSFINRKINSNHSLFGDVSRFYPKTKVHVILKHTTMVEASVVEKYSKNFTFHFAGNNSTREDIWLDIFRRLHTPYVLIASGLQRLTEDVNVERLVRVLSTHDNTHFAGGSVVDSNGHWSNGCLQTQLKNYTLSFRVGYFHSMSECLVCDQLDGPFLVKTSVIQELALAANMDFPPYWDLFLDAKKRYGRHGHAVVTCPDVMFHVTPAQKARETGELAPFARKNEIHKIVGADGTVTWFGCRNGSDVQNSNNCVLKSDLAVPPCCLEYLADAIKFIMTQCERHHILCELQEGTLLGAVKLNKVLPWERDADVTFLTADYQKVKEMENVFIQEGYKFTLGDSPWCCVDGREAGGTFEIVAHDWSIQLYGQHKMDSEGLSASGHPPTKVLFSGQWVNVPANPGLHVRNRYGREMYRHAAHWMSTGAKSSWEEYNTRGFESCHVQGFHGCLDQYLPDGSIQFEHLF